MVTLKQLQSGNSLKLLLGNSRNLRFNAGLAFPSTMEKFLVLEKFGKIDFDVYLPTKGMNLQRPYVWTLQQQEELIWSIIYNKSIPPVIFVQFNESGEETYYVIDGKQRLMTIKRFILNEFPIHFNGKEVYWKNLDVDAKYQINRRVNMTYTAYYSYYDELITDDEKIILFNYYNFAGTPQEESHRNMLLDALSK